MDYLLDIAEAAFCSASDLFMSRADRFLDAICSGWVKQPADELLLSFLREVLDGLLGGEEAHHEQGSEVEFLEHDVGMVGPSALDEVVVMGEVMDGEVMGEIVWGRVWGEAIGEILEGDEREEEGEVMGVEERAIQEGEGEDLREMDDSEISHHDDASEQVRSAILINLESVCSEPSLKWWEKCLLQNCGLGSLRMYQLVR